MKIINNRSNHIFRGGSPSGAEARETRSLTFKCFLIAALLAHCALLEACSCSSRTPGTSPGRTAPRGEAASPFKIGAERFTGAFAAYLKELRAVENQSKLKNLKQIALDQKNTSIAFSRGMDDKSSLLDDPTGKFKELEPLVKENRVGEIITALQRIARENQGDRQVVMEANRKLSLCYYLTGDHIKCSASMAKYNALLEEEVRHEDDLNEQIIKYLKKDIDY